MEFVLCTHTHFDVLTPHLYRPVSIVHNIATDHSGSIKSFGLYSSTLGVSYSTRSIIELIALLES